MTDITIEITVKCQECDSQLDADYNYRKSTLFVHPCDRCIAQAIKEYSQENQ